MMVNYQLSHNHQYTSTSITLLKSLEKLFPWEVEYLQEATDYKGSKLEALINDEDQSTSAEVPTTTSEQADEPAF